MVKFVLIFFLYLLLFNIAYAADYSCPVIPFDINNDGYDEIIAFTVDKKMWIYDKNLIAIYSIETKGLVNRPPAIADIDCDGKMDIIILTLNGYIQVFDAQTGILKKGFENLKIILYRYISPVIADVDGDNFPEIIVAGNQVYAYDYTGKLKPNFPYNLISEVEKPLGIIDYDRDGFKDIFVITQDKRCKIINVKKNVITDDLADMNYKMDIGNNYIIEDINNDSNPEICFLSVNRAPRQPSYFNFKSGLKSILTSTNIYSYNYIAGIAKINNDTYPRYIYTANSKEYGTGATTFISTSAYDEHTINYVSEYENNTSAIHAYPNFYLFSGYSSVFLDYNNDGKLDLISTGYNDGIYIFSYTNNEPDTFQKILALPFSGADMFAVTVGDINGDRNGDIICNDTQTIHIINTQSQSAYSPLPFNDILNSNNQFYIPPPVLITETTIITKGRRFSAEWRKPYYFDNYMFSYSLNNNIFSNYSTDTNIFFDNLADSDYLLRVKAINQNGRESLYPAAIKFAIDNKPPVVYFISPENNQIISPDWNIKIYVKDEHLNTFACYFKTTGEFEKFYESQISCETLTIPLPCFTGDTVTLKIRAEEINQNNFSETEITLSISSISQIITPTDDKLIMLSGGECSLRIFPQTVKYRQNIELRYAQLNNKPIDLYSPVFYLGPQNFVFNNPIELSIKYSDTIIPALRYTSQKTKEKQILQYSAAPQNAVLSLYYSADTLSQSIEKIFSANNNNIISGFVKKSGYYFISQDSPAFVSVSQFNTTASFLEITPRVVRSNSDMRFNFYLSASSAVTIKLFDLNGNLIKTFLKNQLFSEGLQQTVSFQLEDLSLSAGMYIVYFKTNFNEMKKVIFIK